MVLCHEKRGDGVSSLINEKVHKQVLENCIDIPKQVPAKPLLLNEVGISGKTVWIRLPSGLVPFDAKLSVSLDPNVRGIHMSRMEEVISELHVHEFTDPCAYGTELAKRMLLKQDGSKGKVYLSGKLPVKRCSIVSKRTSIDTMEISAEVSVHAENDTSIIDYSRISIGVHHITACPCTQAYNEVLFEKKEDSCPLPTHSQRSFTRFWIDPQNNLPTYEDLLTCMESSLHVTQDLLKRQDEAEIVLKSHRYPQFAEDAVREVAAKAAMQFKEIIPGNTRIEIESTSLESIHIHDVHCRFVGRLDDICRQLSLD